MAEVSNLPSEVISNLCTQSCIDTVKRYRDHNQSMCDDLKRLEKDRRDYVLIVETFEEQIKGFQANELQHSYDTKNWNWVKNELETKLSKSLEENDRLKEKLSKVKLDIEKFSYASKAMDSLLKAQIHDKMKPGIGYNNTPPPYNNNYISPTSDLLETKEKKDLSEEAFKIDPLDEVVVKDLTEKEASENKDSAVSKDIPLENTIITNEGCGKIWVKSKEIEKTKGKNNKVHYKQTTVVNPGSCKQCACNKAKSLNSGIKRGNQRNWNNQWAQKQGVDLNKINRPKPCFICGKLNHLAKYCFFNPINQQMNFQKVVQKPVGYRKAEKKHVMKKSVESKGPMKKKVLKESIKMWVPRSTKTVSTADRDSAAGSITAATSVSTAEYINAANTVSISSKVNTANTVTAANTVTTSNKVSTAKHASAAKAVSTSKTSTASSKNVSKPIIVTKYSKNEELKFKNLGNQQLKGKSIWHVDSGCSRHMTGNMSCLQHFKHINGGHVAFGDNLTGGKITGKGNVTKGKMTFEDVYYVDQLKYNLLSVSQVCDKQHRILFTNTECMILAPGFKVVDESMILLRTPRKNNVYCLDMDNAVSDSSLNCLVSKASVDESSLWHRRMCHMNFKTMNKLVKNNLVRGLPSKVFSCDDHCVACLKGKQHKTSHKIKEINSISSCLQLLHMDLFGPTNVMSIGKKSYCLVIVDDYYRFTWVYFLRTKDETSGLIKSFILRIENQTNQKVKVIRSDNGTEFKNLDLNTFCEEKGIERQYSAPRTPQQNGDAERRNRTLIEAARSLLADSKLPITFWAEAVNTACKFDSKADDGFLVGYSSQSKAYRVFNSSSRIIEESDNVKCNENTPNPIGSGPQWLFDIDSLTNSFGFSSDDYAGSGSGGSGTTQVSESISQSVIFPIPTVNPVEACGKEPSTGPSQSEEESRDEETQENKEPEVATENTSVELNDSNLEVGLNEEPSHNTRIHKNHPPQLLEPKKAHDAMKESSWIEAMQEELLQFKLQDVWDLVDLPKGQRAIGTKWVFRNKKDERGIVIRNKARLVAQGYTQEEGIDNDEVFAPVARIEAIRLFLAYASYMKFKAYQMDVKSAFLYGSIEEEVYVCQPPGFENPSHPDRVYKLKKALYGLHQAPRAWYDTLSSYLLENGFERGVIDKTLFIKRKKKDILLVQIYVDDIIFGSTRDNMCKEFEELMHQRFKMSSMGELTFFLGLQVQQKSDGIFICQSKYVQDILTKFGFSDSKPGSTPMETHKQITADLEGEDMDVHHYRSMIGSLMYLTASRPDIMFPVCVCARFQVRPKQSHYQAVKRIFKYLKGQPRLGLWYPHDSSFDLLAYSDSDLGGANLDRKSTFGGCQFLGARLVSWQCEKQTTVSTSTTKAEYIAATSCCSQVLWIQNQMLDYGVTFLHTPTFIDNSSAISIVNNPVKHSKTKHIEIRYHFIRDCNEKKLIQVVKVHTDNQFADLFTKAFDDMYSSTQYFARLKEQEHPCSMASMSFIDEHNEIAMLQKPKQAAGFHQIVDFLKTSHIAYALTVSPSIYIDHQRQLRANATIVAENGVQKITTRVCEKPLTVTEESFKNGVWRPIGVFKFSKAKFSPQWRFLVHTLMHCISKKTTGWSEFSSPITYALVCLATARRYNFSQMIFNDLVSNMGNKKSFYMYPRFVQAVINHELTDIPHSDGIYVPKPPKGKVFSNMRRSVGDSEGVDTPLFSTMMVVSQTNEGMVAGSRPPLDQPTASQSQPSHSKSIPQSLLDKPTSPITQTYQRKQVKKAPSLLVPSPTNPLSPLRENSPLENIQRETNRVSPNPQEVPSKEILEHMGEKAATTSASTEKDSGNISKTFPMATLNEQSFKGPRCQETKGVDSASARQKTSTTKRSHDPSKGGNTPGEGEDRYDYNELMETMGNSNMDVIKQGKEIEELKLVILSQQVQITKLKKLVKRLVLKKKKKQFVLKKRVNVQDPFNKGEKPEGEKEKEISTIKEVEVEGETEHGTTAETVNAAKIQEAAETEAETVNVARIEAEETGLSIEEMEIAETLVKAKNDTPKATQKAKGVVINEEGISKKQKEKEVLKDIKGKGKEKMVEEAELPTKKKSQIEMDEAIAKQLQDQMEKEEQLQTETGRELAKIMARKLNAEYQKSIKEAAHTKKLQVKKMPVMKQKRQPYKTFLANQERRKMINFLKGAIGVKGEMFTNMAYSEVEELYRKEMAKVQGDSSQREEVERRMKERHDLNIQQPFPEETTPSKDKAEEKKEEHEGVGIEAKSGKRVKSIASKRQLKKPRVEETEKEAEPSVTSPTEPVQSPEQSNKQTVESMDLYMTIVEPLKAVPISMKAPEITFWDILRDNGKNFFRIKRADGSFEAYSTWGRVVRSCSRADIEELYKVGIKLYEPVLKGTEENLLKIAMEYLCMMFDPEKVAYRIKDHQHEIYEHSKEKLEGMLKATLVCTKDSEMAKIMKLMLLSIVSAAYDLKIRMERMTAGKNQDIHGRLEDNDGRYTEDILFIVIIFLFSICTDLIE
ncbi:hypothetical protein L6452_38806 [Arctium lappa]|uniref:Uncharacterized protein n=1 Tax=Arctium lappa TaxID=4217 RepID=A0ACB8XRR1_ARCLA|nr:hypothetical protein L6452_38806 [Arctium lappa]